jgi:NADH:ubiquinone oxidoreductase subunit 6 (subunit J)
MPVLRSLMITTVHSFLLGALVVSATWTVLTARLLRSAIGLALTSVILTILMFQLASPLAAVFELSVGAGLIAAIFISAISLTQRMTAQDQAVRRKERLHRYWFLPLILLIVGAALLSIHFVLDVNLPAPAAENDVRIVLWKLRHLDLLGQIAILLAGAFGVVILFKEWKNGQ